MRDLHLWRLLLERPFDASAALPLLAGLAARPLQERVPFLGLLPVALGHADPAVRQAAVSALAGARGRPALQRLVAALSDESPAVREAGVDALRVSVQGGDWARWV